MMNINWPAALLLVVCAASGPGAAGRQTSHKFEQRHFSVEAAGVERPVPIPNDVLAILREDESVRSLLDDQGISTDKLPSTWFSASSVHLGDSSETDMVIKGEEPITGANVTTFWVFVATPRGHELVLTTVAHDLLVRNERKNGRPEIQTMSATALKATIVSFRFNGRRYQQFQTQAEKAQGRDAK
jgi:hypothetical protein